MRGFTFVILILVSITSVMLIAFDGKITESGGVILDEIATRASNKITPYQNREKKKIELRVFPK